MTIDSVQISLKGRPKLASFSTSEAMWERGGFTSWRLNCNEITLSRWQHVLLSCGHCVAPLVPPRASFEQDGALPPPTKWGGKDLLRPFFYVESVRLSDIICVNGCGVLKHIVRVGEEYFLFVQFFSCFNFFMEILIVGWRNRAMKRTAGDLFRN